MAPNILIFTFLFGLVSANECGTVKYIEPRIVAGTEISRGEWPFLAALYYIEEARFFCGATLISAGHVLTAAHCVQQKNSVRKLAPEDVVVLLGAYNLDSKIERGIQQRDVAEIHVHPDWKIFCDKYDADIAIFVLSSAVWFTDYIRPVCIPADTETFHDIKGSIVGWGLAENTTPGKHESIPRHAFTTALNDSYCYTSASFIAAISSIRTFCGGGEGGSPNKGDSGGGFFVKSGSVWMQYGIISASEVDSSGALVPGMFSVYTNVKSHYSWIDSIVQGSVVKMLTEPHCNFEFTSFYTCSVWGSNITVQDLEVKTFTGNHLASYTNQNVTQIWFWQGNLEYIPNGIGLIFQHLDKFLVGYDDTNLGLKQIHRSNFENMHLTLLQLHDSYIETVDTDTLWDLVHLEVFVLVNSRLKVLPATFFEKNVKLRQVNGNGNEIEYLPLDLFKHNPLIEEVSFKDNKLRSISADFSALKMVHSIDLHGNACFDRALKDVHNLSEFQDLIWYYC
ncbi:chymotrypsin-like elastase family member 2A [Bradysia coprophila]|uniref:chymotrypsin-like elastase family member 2A n=1 Tax=Bradysia coprophila TaxID=38358 RepID=UPI00187D8753|nr:chymotrypsin-like elastase family member 2A [Bradysia coprophila]